MPKKRDNCGEEGFTAAAGAAGHRAVRGVVALAYRTPIPARRGQRRGPDISPLVTAGLRASPPAAVITLCDPPPMVGAQCEGHTILAGRMLTLL